MALAQKNKDEPYSKDEHKNRKMQEQKLTGEKLNKLERQKYFQWTDCIPKTVQE